MNEGFLFINKSKGISSFGCIKQIKKIIGKKIKIGHAGTLDPFATGLLIIGIGRGATKYLNFFTKSDKEYIATGKLGILTDTRTIIQEDQVSTISEQDLLNAIKALGKEYQQTPPKFSALKYEGKPLYKLARKGIVFYHSCSCFTRYLHSAHW